MMFLTISHNIFQELIRIVLQNLGSFLSTKPMDFIKLDKLLDLFIFSLILSDLELFYLKNISHGTICNKV